MQLRRQEYKMILKYIRKNKKAIMKFSMSFMLCCFIFLAAVPAYAGATGSKSNVSQQDTEDSFHLNITSNAGSTTLESTLQMLLILTALSLAPSIIIMVTSFTRIIVVFHFLRTALGTQTTPPNQVLIGLALFMSISNHVSGYDKSEQRGSSALYEWKSKAGTGDRKRTGSNSDVYVKADKRQRSQIVYDD